MFSDGCFTVESDFYDFHFVLSFFNQLIFRHGQFNVANPEIVIFDPVLKSFFNLELIHFSVLPKIVKTEMIRQHLNFESSQIKLLTPSWFNKFHPFYKDAHDRGLYYENIKSQPKRLFVVDQLLFNLIITVKPDFKISKCYTFPELMHIVYQYVRTFKRVLTRPKSPNLLIIVFDYLGALTPAPVIHYVQLPQIILNHASPLD